MTDCFVNFETAWIFCWRSNVLTAGQVEETGASDTGEDVDTSAQDTCEQDTAAQSLTNEVQLIRHK